MATLSQNLTSKDGKQGSTYKFTVTPSSAASAVLAPLLLATTTAPPTTTKAATTTAAVTTTAAPTTTSPPLSNKVTRSGTNPSYITLSTPTSVVPGAFFSVSAAGDWQNASGAVWKINGVANTGCLNPGCGFYAPTTPGTAVITYTVNGLTGTLNVPVVASPTYAYAGMYPKGTTVMYNNTKFQAKIDVQPYRASPPVGDAADIYWTKLAAGGGRRRKTQRKAVRRRRGSRRH
jgi:hypothetical protein